MNLTDLYTDIILDHFRNPRNYGELDGAAVSVNHDNPVCGDKLTLYVNIEDGVLAALKYSGEGCAISQASASMMTECLEGKTVVEAENLLRHFKAMMMGESEPNEELLGDIIALEGVSQFPIRVKCAVLPWNALQDALQQGS
jgi:nitrogen fixation NifU-like protein